MNDFVPEIEGSRGLAASAVLITHISAYSRLTTIPFVPLIPFTLTGWSGVVFFFILSGYLFTKLYFPHLSLKRHFVRRVFRTFPLYYLSIPLFLAWGGLRYTPLDLFYLQNYFPGAYQDTVYWTLCIEELFYFVALPFLFAIVRRYGIRRLLVASIFLSSAWAIWANSVFVSTSSDFLVKQFPTYFVCYNVVIWLALEAPKVSKTRGFLWLLVSLTSLSLDPAQFYSTLIATL